MLYNNTKPNYYNYLLKYLHKDVISIISNYTNLKFKLIQEIFINELTQSNITCLDILDNQTVIISIEKYQNTKNISYYYHISKSYYESNTLFLIDLNTFKKTKIIDVILDKNTYYNVGFNSILVILDQTHVIVQSTNYNLQLIDIFTKKITILRTGHKNTITCLKIINKNLIITGSTDKTVRVFDLKQNKSIYTFKEHTLCISCIAIINDSTIVSGSRDNTLRIFDLNEKNSLKFLNIFKKKNNYKVLKGHANSVLSVVVYNDKIVSSSFDSTLRIWDFNGKILQIINVNKNIFNMYVLNDNTLLTLCNEKYFQIFNMLENNIQKKDQTISQIYKLNVFPDGRLFNLDYKKQCFEIYN